MCDSLRELGIKGWEHLGGGLHDRHVDPLGDEVLCHLETDEPSPDDDRGLGGDVDVEVKPLRVLDRTEGSDPVVARDGWTNGRCTHGENELFVLDLGDHVRGRGADGHDVPLPVDRHHLGVDPDVESEPVEEQLGRLQREVFLLFDEPPDEVGKSAVGERDEARALKHDDADVRVQSTQSGRRRHATGYAPDDHDPTSSTHPFVDGLHAPLLAIVSRSSCHLCLVVPAIPGVRPST